MADNRWTLSALTIVGLGPIAALGMLVIPARAATTPPAPTSTTSEVRTKLQQFDLSKMSVEEIGNIKNSVLKQVLENTRKKDFVAHDSHSSSHSKNSLRRSVT
ncbi:hypothetical protein [Nostoc sp. 'Peltigera membranacea cyanobiont' 232]|uniref:hypothetical protein n=1 Tax=Nostoc sp. 'Peltigera membranacea cyanobiont' 232 TaxID=2014531 RepID=UPI000B95446A|nr:hypothetical protein [Nostoc sp. 'Peltigera membranacea cyanobiont' 232]OYE01194.1 hypothetical protein CDG79_30940 [Nostoc sp. 'Peltigera membranacea cyanobiont' 232]